MSSRVSERPTGGGGGGEEQGGGVLLCLAGTSEEDPAVPRAAELCRESGARLSIVVPLVDVAAPRGCCGIQGEHWSTLLDEQTAEDVGRVTRLLEHLGCRAEDVEIEVGPSVREIVLAATERLGSDLVVVSRRRRPWSGWGLSRRELRSLAGARVPLEIVKL